MKQPWHVRRYHILVAALGLFALGLACAGEPLNRTPQASPTAAVTPTVAQSPALRYYGSVYVYPQNTWSEADRSAIRETLVYAKSLGMNTIVQTFSTRVIGTGQEQDWLIFLDEAERADIKIIARLWPLEDWVGQAFDLGPVATFLNVVQGHPALQGYLGLHEPLEKYTSEQLRTFYTGVKEIAPHTPIAHYIGNMALFENSPRFPGRDFSDGICDICIVWCTPFQSEDGTPVFVETEVRETIEQNHALIASRDPDAQLWFLGQTYALAEHRHALRMPTPEEMEALFVIATENDQLDGFLWYPWYHGNYDHVLGEPEMETQRQAVRRIYDTHISNQP